MREDAKPTVRQVYALARVLCQMCDEPFPETRKAASDLIERFRRELGLPNASLEDASARRQPAPRTLKFRELARE